MATAALNLDARERRLLDEYQRDFPTTPRPFAEIAVRLGTTEDAVIESCRKLQAGGVISRIGATVAPHAAGWSTLAAMEVPAARLAEVAALVSAYDEVNHNYEREHRINLWFVIAAPSRARGRAVLDDIARRTGIAVLDLALEEAYRLDLGFPLQWT